MEEFNSEMPFPNSVTRVHQISNINHTKSRINLEKLMINNSNNNNDKMKKRGEKKRRRKLKDN